MAQTVIITLLTAAADTGPFDLYSDADGFSVAFETGVPKTSLLSGYSSSLVPDIASVIRVQSASVLCTNYIDLDIVTSTTTTTSTSSTSTTSTTTTAALGYKIYWFVNNSAGGNLKIYPTSTPGSPLVNQDTTSTTSGNTSITTSVSYTIKGTWLSGSGNVIKYRVCDLDNGTQLYASPDITISSTTDTYTFILPLFPTTHNISVTLYSGGITPPTCPIP